MSIIYKPSINGLDAVSIITIGSPANGLSVDSSQVLTIDLASATLTGALSSTDWNTFNNKQDAIVGNPLAIAGYDIAGAITSIPNWTYEAANGALNVIVPKIYSTDPGGTYEFERVANTIDPGVAPGAPGTNANGFITGVTFDQPNSGGDFGSIKALSSFFVHQGDGDVLAITGFDQQMNLGNGTSGSAQSVVGANINIDVQANYSVNGAINVINMGGNIAGPVSSSINLMYSGMSINAPITNNFYGPYLQPNFNDSIGGGFQGFTCNDTWQTGSSVVGHQGLSLNPNVLSGATMGNMTLISMNPQMAVGTFVGSSLTGLALASTISSAFQSYQVVSANPSIAGVMSGGYAAFTDSANFQSGGTVANYNGLTLQPTAQSGAHIDNFLGVNINPNIASGATPANSVTFFAGNMGNEETLGSLTGLRLNNNGAGDIGNYNGIQIQPGGTGVYTGAVNGLNIDVSTAAINTANALPGTAISSQGFHNMNAQVNVPVGTSGFFSMNNLGGQFIVDATVPVTNTFGILTSLASVIEFNDDVGPDPSGFDLGIATVGFVGQVAGAAGKTFDTLNFCVGGASVPPGSGGGTVTNINVFKALGILDGGGGPGSLLIDNMYGFSVGDQFTAMAPTNAWGVHINDINCDNYFAKNVVIGGVTGKSATNVELDVTGDALITGDAKFGDITEINTVPYSFTNTQGSANDVLTNDGAGNLTWAPAASITVGNLTSTGGANLSVTGGTGAVVGAGTSISQSAATTAANGYLTATDWNTFNNKQPAGNYITDLTGDATATGPGSAALTLATVNSNVGSFGSASSVGAFTVNAKGLITAASSTSIQIAESQVTNLVTDLAGKLSNVLASGDILVGNGSNVATAVTMSGDVTINNAGVTAIGANKVTNAQLAQMAAHTYKGNNTAGASDPLDVTATQLTADLNLFTSALQGLVPASGGGTTTFLRADGTFAAPAAITIGAIDSVTKSANGGVITASVLYFQTADATNPGLVSTGTQTFAGNKTFTGTISASNLSGTNTGDVTLAAVGATPNANGASLSGQVLNLQPADGTNPGVVTTGAQTLAGVKTFSSAPNLSSLTASLPLQLDASKNIISTAIDLATSQVTGTLVPTKGGTGLATYTTGDILYASASNVLSKLAIGSTGQRLGVVAGVPAWQANTPGSFPFAAGYHDTDCAWQANGSTAFQNPADDPTGAFTQDLNSSLTLSSVGSISPAITWTPDQARTYLVTANVCVNNNGTNVATSVRLVDGSDVELPGPSAGIFNDAGGNTTGEITISGYLVAPNTSAVTVKVQIATANSGQSGRIQTPNSGLNQINPIKWSVQAIT